MRFFNTAGPVRPELHYCLDPLARLDLDEVLGLVGQEKYFVLHAPRQTGKTTCLFALVKLLNESGQYRALYANIERAQADRENVTTGIRSVVEAIADAAEWALKDRDVVALASDIVASSTPTSLLGRFLSQWCQASDKPTVLMLDEVDALVGDTLISVLRQLREGYNNRPAAFPQSIVLCGIRDVRDYRIHSSKEKAIITGGSAFNIRAKSLRLGDFSREEIERLYAEHTAETGQGFEQDALDQAWELSCGQPWVVNALAYEACFEMREGRDRSRPITGEMIDQAKERLILERVTHLDQLADKLSEERVRRVIEPLLAGDSDAGQLSQDDIEYVRDLGLIRTEGQIRIANALYQEVIPRELTYARQLMIPQEPQWYIRDDGSLDMAKLVAAFQQFFREHSESWVERFEYREAGPQLLLQAFLQRIVNGGGQIHREYGLGMGRTDLLVKWPVPSIGVVADRSRAKGSDQRFVLELKVIGGPRWKGSVESTISKGVEQTAGYMQRSDATEGHLIIFDRNPEKTWDEKVWRRDEELEGRVVTVWGM